MTPPVTVIGIGNPYRRDDGAAACVLSRLESLVDPARVRLVELDGEPVRLIQAWEGSDSVWLVDAVRSGRPPGTFHEVSAEQLGAIDDHGVRIGGGHLMGLSEAFELARVLDLLPKIVHVLGIEGADFADGVGLSADVEVGCAAAAAHIASRIELDVGD